MRLKCEPSSEPLAVVVLELRTVPLGTAHNLRILEGADEIGKLLVAGGGYLHQQVQTLNPKPQAPNPEP
jgi:hypothetical protein